MPEVSVIVTTYKRENTVLQRAVKSLLSQTFEDIEVIVVDDNPPAERERYDVEGALSQLADSRVRYIAHEKNMGAPAARNTGIKNALGRFVCFLDDDDEYYPEKISFQMEALKKTGLKMAVCGFDIHDEETGNKRRVAPRFGRGDKRAWLCGRNFIATPNPLIAAECFESCGVFDTQMKSAQDLELWIRILGKYDTAVVKDALYVQHLHPGERISANPARQLEGINRLMDKNDSLLKEEPQAHARLLMVKAKRYLQLGNENSAKGCMMRAESLYPLHSLYYRAQYMLLLRKYGKKAR